MAATGRVKAWRDLLEKNYAVPVAFDRQKTELDISTPFSLCIKNIEGLLPKVGLPLLTSFRPKITTI